MLNPKSWSTLILVFPDFPFFVVTITTPAFALVPYIAAADAPLSTSILSISSGLRSAILFEAPSSEPEFAPEANLEPPGISALLI